MPGLLEQAAKDLDAGLAELREIARGLHPALLSEHGLLRALEALVERSPLPVVLDVADERLDPDLEATALLHRLRGADQRRQARPGVERARSRSPTTGRSCAARSPTTAGAGADLALGTGLLGLRDRAEAAGGTLSVVSPPGRGTTLTAALPL